MCLCLHWRDYTTNLKGNSTGRSNKPKPKSAEKVNARIGRLLAEDSTYEGTDVLM